MTSKKQLREKVENLTLANNELINENKQLKQQFGKDTAKIADLDVRLQKCKEAYDTLKNKSREPLEIEILCKESALRTTKYDWSKDILMLPGVNMRFNPQTIHIFQHQFNVLSEWHSYHKTREKELSALITRKLRANPLSTNVEIYSWIDDFFDKVIEHSRYIEWGAGWITSQIKESYIANLKKRIINGLRAEIQL